MVHKHKVVQSLIYISVTLASFLALAILVGLTFVRLMNMYKNHSIQILLLFFGPLEILCLVDGDHTDEMYSRTDLIIDM